MKNTMKLTALLLSLVMVFALTACGSDGGGSSNDNPYNLDYTSADLQPMSDERASKDALLDAKEYYLTGLSSTPEETTKETYQDMASRIGVDASEFQYFADYGQYRYTWYVEGNNGPALTAAFDTSGKLLSVSASIS